MFNLITKGENVKRFTGKAFSMVHYILESFVEIKLLLQKEKTTALLNVVVLDC